ncbi:hypothetical protein [Yinghuangia soli]|uniref:Uncharacterized protein n=1 Tax=Yinghuangia soli TaxID=2908204 RepID=A0AA41U1N4_9ACTN|nr:hypothetical protein [Yinghuangia soli]MCF2529831.1 hypothetical protein [Yinghuangia soli]
MDDEEAGVLLARWRHARQVADLPARFTELLQDQFDAEDLDAFLAPFDPEDADAAELMGHAFPVLQGLPDGSLAWRLTGPPDVVPHAEDLGVTFTAVLQLEITASNRDVFRIRWQYTVTRPEPAAPLVVTHVEDLTFGGPEDYETWLAAWRAEYLDGSG